MDRSVYLRIGEPTLFDGVGVFARGDVLIIAYSADASLQRTRWLHTVAEEFSNKCPTTFLALLLIPSGTKPPDPATRAEDAARYARVLPKIRRLVVVPEGTGFRASLVRLVIGAYCTLTGKRSLVIATNVEQGLVRLQEATSPLTPSIEQLSNDLEALRTEISTSYPQPTSQRSASMMRLFGK
ncbi:MAG TPA: hypothetical protein VFN67_19590 [Polyangiales bacterium]|nr:hypothetical protein [Polyangiales bacterium]